MIIENFEYRNAEDKIITVEKVELEPCFNQIKFGQAFTKFNQTCNYDEYASVVLPLTVISPSEFKDKQTFVNDFEALDELLGHINDMMSKKWLAQPKRKQSTIAKG